MNRYVFLGQIAFLLLLIGGCGKTTDPSKSGSSEPVSRSDTPTESIDSEQSKSDSDATPEDTDADTVASDDQDGDATQDDANNDSEQTAEADNDKYSTERILLITVGGPLVVDLKLSRNGKPFYGEIQTKIQQVVKAADTDGDGKATWAELVQNTKFQQSKLGLALVAVKPVEAWKGNFDGDADAMVDPDEVERMMNDSTQTSVFDLQAGVINFSKESQGGILFKSFDTDSNESINAEEIAMATKRLWLHDADGDGVLLMRELAGGAERSVSTDSLTKPTRTHQAALHLHSSRGLVRNMFAIKNIYQIGRKLTPESFAGIPKLFETIDKDGNGRLHESELRRLCKIPAHITVVADFTVDQKSKETTASRVELLNVNQDLKKNDQDHAKNESRVHVDVGVVQLSLVANSGSQGERLRLSVDGAQDGLFKAFDQDGDGRLTLRETADIPELLAMLDSNQDGAISSKEIPIHFSMVASRANFTPPDMQRQIANAGAAEETPVVLKKSNAPLWFDSMDGNRDGDLSVAEFMGTIEQFRKFDQDQNGLASAQEVVDSLAKAIESSE